MNEIDDFKVFVLCSGDVTAHVDRLHIKRIHLVDFSYIVINNIYLCELVYNPRYDVKF
jgi:hypothetical protein